MGLDPKKSRPEDMLEKIFPIPPVAVRPSAKADFLASSSMEDDLTHKLTDIVRASMRCLKYKEDKNSNEKYRADQCHLLQYHIASYYDNDTLTLPKAEQKGKPLKSLSARIKGKEGRVRGNLMGKRVNFSARTVITPDPTIDLNELGVPLKVAMNLTFPEIVTTKNIDKLYELVLNGRKKYPGANFVFKCSNINNSSGRIFPIDLRYRTNGVNLRVGDIVERHLITGDFVLLNRQPTLHKLSMMGHKIKVINNDKLSTFRLNPAVCNPYNADFDGDEMNIFVPQSIQAMIELEYIADVKRQIITPAKSIPIIGIIQDGLLGSYNLTKDDTTIDWKSAMNILSMTDINDYTVIDKKDCNGKDLFSKIIPEKINVNRKGCVIKNGIIEKGQLNKSFLGSKKGSLMHLVWNEYGMDTTKKFIDNAQRLVNNFNLYYGFSVGIGDIDISKKLYDEMNNLFETKMIETDCLITEMENNPNLLDNSLFEQTIFSDLNTIRDTVSSLIMKNINDTNAFYIMSPNGSGSKGSSINVGQMGGCVGQQTLEGGRIKKKINGRTLGCFSVNDDSAIGRGFIPESYLRGLRPSSFFFHNMTAREGIIDTAIKTAESGYIQRKLIKGMEDSIVQYDYTVRNARDTILQFIYGDNGINTIHQSEHTIKLIEYGDKDITDEFGFNASELKKLKFSNNDYKKYINEIKEFRRILRLIQFKCSLDNKTVNNKFMLPVNLHVLIDNNLINNNNKSNMLPSYILDKINSIFDHKNTKLICYNEKNNNSYLADDEKLSKTIFKIAIHEFLSPKSYF